MPGSDEAKRRTFIPPLTLDHILITNLINAPSPVTPQPPKPCFNSLGEVPTVPKHKEITKKRMAITELVNDDTVSEPSVKRQKLVHVEPVTPIAAAVEQLPSTSRVPPENNAQPSSGVRLQTLAALATTSTVSDGEEKTQSEYKHEENTIDSCSKNVLTPQNITRNTNTRQTIPFPAQPNSLSSSSARPPSPSQKDRKYVCHICNFRFHQAGGLRNHTRAVHLKEKPYGCVWPGCLRYGERGFAARGDLTRHVSSVHKGERKFRCGRCTMRFARRSVLVRHDRNIHGIGKR